MPAADRFAADTSVVVPLLAAWHEHHALAVKAWSAQLAANRVPLLVGHVLLEAFAVLTRLPAPYRTTAQIARAALQELSTGAVMASVTTDDCFEAMRIVEHNALSGGTVYDALICVTAARAGAGAFLTMNLRDHLRVAPSGLRIVHPGE